jgi:hypothetical protein
MRNQPPYVCWKCRNGSTRGLRGKRREAYLEADIENGWV